jgi:hypothetical protein
MKVLMRLSLITVVAFAAPIPVLAHSHHQSHRRTQATPGDSWEFTQGDYYTTGKTVARKASRRESNEFRYGDYYAPGRY